MHEGWLYTCIHLFICCLWFFLFKWVLNKCFLLLAYLTLLNNLWAQRENIIVNWKRMNWSIILDTICGSVKTHLGENFGFCPVLHFKFLRCLYLFIPLTQKSHSWLRKWVIGKASRNSQKKSCIFHRLKTRLSSVI